MVKVNKKFLAVVLAIAAIHTTAQASDWGCQCLLCLSDPRGPTTESECQPPIKKLWRQLAKGKPFPTCEMSGDSHANIGSSHYELCPEGYGTLGTGQYAIKKADSKNTVGTPFYVGVSDESNQANAPKVCVADLVGTKDITIPTDDNSPTTAIGQLNNQFSQPLTVEKQQIGWNALLTRTVKAGVYTDIKTMPYHGSMIDVYIDGTINRRVPVGGN